jgi:hypothetical protein
MMMIKRLGHKVTAGKTGLLLLTGIAFTGHVVSSLEGCINILHFPRLLNTELSSCIAATQIACHPT